MSTLRDLISGSLRLIGAIASGETPSSAELADAMITFNTLRETWAIEGLLVPEVTREVFLLTPGQREYFFGPSGHFNSVRPVKLIAAAHTIPNVVTTIITPYDPGDPLGTPPVDPTPEVSSTTVYATQEVPVNVLNYQEWINIHDKTLSSSVVQKIYMEGKPSSEIVSVWPIPTTASGIVLYTQKEFSEVLDATTPLFLPPGYIRALRYNLAVDLSPEYGKAIDPSIAMIAKETKAMIKRQNTQPVYSVSDAFGMTTRGRYNINTGR